MTNDVLNGIMGLCVGDVLGVPVEFVDRKTLMNNPVTDMRAYGTYNQPAGTWSDDTSLILCLTDSLSKGLDYKDMMNNFSKWFNMGEYTPYGEVFDVGGTTREALMRYKKGINPLECGGTSEYSNGNGSLMRILPILFYLNSLYGTEFMENDEAFQIIHNISSLTHGHKRSQIACGIYISVATELIGKMDLKLAIKSGIFKAIEYYRESKHYSDELKHFKRLDSNHFEKIPIDEIRSSGYVVHTLEAAIWCLLNTKSYKDCVLRAVNLGSDTDTVAAVAGGLAGLYYGYDDIPKEWLDTIARREYIEDLCNQLYNAVTRTSIEKLYAYIPFFETATKENVCNWSGGEKLGKNSFTMPYPEYDSTLNKFIKEVYKTNLIRYDYLDFINKYGLYSCREMVGAINDADLELLKAILTGYVRQERFNDGLWVNAVEDKVFLNILKRLREIV